MISLDFSLSASPGPGNREPKPETKKNESLLVSGLETADAVPRFNHPAGWDSFSKEWHGDQDIYAKMTQQSIDKRAFELANSCKSGGNVEVAVRKLWQDLADDRCKIAIAQKSPNPHLFGAWSYDTTRIAMDDQSLITTLQLQYQP